MNRLIADGYQVLALSTCTSIDRYNRDDRMVALRMAKYVNDSEHFHIAMDELNDVEIGKILASCVLTIGTRLHSAIISMNFGTPAIAINYEHKSAGIMQQLGGGIGYRYPSLAERFITKRGGRYAQSIACAKGKSG